MIQAAIHRNGCSVHVARNDGSRDACDLIWLAYRKPQTEFDPSIGLRYMHLGLEKGLGAV